VAKAKAFLNAFHLSESTAEVKRGVRDARFDAKSLEIVVQIHNT
jgi:hypothetical protein